MGKGKKGKQQNKSTKIIEGGEQIVVFEDLDDFFIHLTNETHDGDFDTQSCRLTYIPPFVMQQAHDNPDKINFTQNGNSKKFVRHLHQHAERHLLKGIRDCLDMPALKFGEKSKPKKGDNDTLFWKFGESTEHLGKRFRIDVVLTCNKNDAVVQLDYKTTPITDEIIRPESANSVVAAAA